MGWRCERGRCCYRITLVSFCRVVRRVMMIKYYCASVKVAENAEEHRRGLKLPFLRGCFLLKKCDIMQTNTEFPPVLKYGRDFFV